MNKMMAGVSLAAVLASLPAWAQPTEITECGTYGPGSYVLANDIGPIDFPDTCLIVSDGTTIDLAGFRIEGRINGISGGENVTVRNGSFGAEFAAVNLGDGAIVEGLNIILGGTGIAASGIVRRNTIIFRGGGQGAVGISASGVITNNYVNSVPGDGIVVGAGSTVIGNTSTNNGGAGISASCPTNLVDNTAVGNGQNLVLNGKGCINKDNVVPHSGANVTPQQQ